MSDSGDNPKEQTVELAEVSDRAAAINSVDYFRALLRDKVTAIAALFLLVLLIAAAGAEFLAPHDPNGANLRARFVPPFGTARDGTFYLFGTDELGRDVLSRLMHGATVSMSIGLLGAFCSALVGISLGVLAGFYRGMLEVVLMRAVDGMMALPSLLIALFILFVIGSGFANLIFIFTLLHWMIFARMARSLTLSYKEQTYVIAARAVGATDLRIIMTHILPNMISPLLVLFTLEIAVLILSEASLSFLGFGVQPPRASWGLMIARGREYISSAWWLVVMPGMAIFLAALCLNLVAAWARAVSDPVQRWRWLAKPPIAPEPVDAP
ncbi:MAG: peptide/nickel transport system permease protein [Granulosicoccus sp.]|jgi:peptide/nickel transport system permease protein